jgi:hypothetical protein
VLEVPEGFVEHDLVRVEGLLGVKGRCLVAADAGDDPQQIGGHVIPRFP